MTATQRPQLWLFRTRRFWGGLVLLLFLVGCWGGSTRIDAKFQYSQRPVFEIQHDWVIGVRDGEVFLSKLNPPWTIFPSCARSFMDWHFEKDRSPGDYSLLPGWWAYDDEWSLRFPLGLLPALWTLLWPWWILRGERAETKRFRTPAPPSHPAG